MLRALLLGSAAVVVPLACGGSSAPAPPPAGAAFEYQLGGAAPLPDGVEVVVRQWSGGEAVEGAYSICYVNAFQTEADGDHPDAAANWPAAVVWRDGGDDPDWPGEYAIDISTEDRRDVAVAFVTERLRTCDEAGFDAVELDNLDTFTRYDGAPFDRDDAIAYATDLVDAAEELGLAAGQKNTRELLDVAERIGFRFAIVEQCGEFDECEPFVDTFGGRVLAVEYSAPGLAAACASIGEDVAVIERDLDLVAPDDPAYVYETC